MKHDLFISHAWEDKQDVARPLALGLAKRGYKVWYDEFELKLGDSLSRTIDHGLKESRYGLVILSPSFLSKRWPERELSGLVAREMSSADKVILPVWHRVSHADIAQHSPPLADKMAVDTAAGLPNVILQIERAIASPAKRSLDTLQYEDLPSLFRRALIEEAMKSHAFKNGDLDRLLESKRVLELAEAKEQDQELLDLIKRAKEHIEEELKAIAEDMMQENP